MGAFLALHITFYVRSTSFLPHLLTMPASTAEQMASAAPKEGSDPVLPLGMCAIARYAQYHEIHISYDLQLHTPSSHLDFCLLQSLSINVLDLLCGYRLLAVKNLLEPS